MSDLSQTIKMLEKIGNPFVVTDIDDQTILLVQHHNPTETRNATQLWFFSEEHGGSFTGVTLGVWNKPFVGFPWPIKAEDQLAVVYRRAARILYGAYFASDAEVADDAEVDVLGPGGEEGAWVTMRVFVRKTDLEEDE